MAGQRKRAQKPMQRNDKQLPTLRAQVNTVRDPLARYQAKFEAVLPSMLPASRMIEVTMTEIARNPELLRCTQSSLIGCVIQCAQLGLQPGIVGEAYLIPFKNNRRNITECTLVVGYKGLLKLAFNSGAIESVQCSVVHLRDEFSFEMGTQGFVRHIPAKPQLPPMPEESASAEEWASYSKSVEALWDSFNPGPMTHAYVVIDMKDGKRPTWEVFDRAKILRAKKSSRAAASGSSPWQSHEDEMWMKTVLRHVCKRLPASIDRVKNAVALDERADAGVSQGLGALVPELEAQAASVENGAEDQGANGDTAGEQASADEQGGGDHKEQANE